MNEIQLSDSLPVIETEIRQYQNLAGESIFEIGRRLKHVKESDLAHGEFGKWLGKIKMDWNTANRFMKVSNELPNSDTYHNLGSNALYLITTLPEPEREKEHITSKGESKTPDEMTVKELRELKRQLKEKDEALKDVNLYNEQLKETEKILQNKLDEAENKEPDVIEKYSEPEDYEDTKNMNEHLTKEREYYKKLANDFRDEIKGLSHSSEKDGGVNTDVIDQTNLVLEMLAHIEKIMNSETASVNSYEVKDALTKIIKKVDE